MRLVWWCCCCEAQFDRASNIEHTINHPNPIPCCCVAFYLFSFSYFDVHPSVGTEVYTIYIYAPSSYSILNSTLSGSSSLCRRRAFLVCGSSSARQNISFQLKRTHIACLSRYRYVFGLIRFVYDARVQIRWGRPSRIQVAVS